MQPCVRGSWIKKIVRESKLQITTIQITNTIILTISIAFVIIILGLFLNSSLRKFLVSDDFIPTMLNVPSFEINQSMNRLTNFEDWIAPKEVWHSMSDEELLWRASMVTLIKEYPYNRTPKVAFMFLTRKMLPLAPLWELFFKEHQGLYSIYIHISSPEFVDEPLESSVFYKQRRLLANALLDFSNERFILLSESCIPLFNFTTIYNYLINSNQSFVGSIDDPRPVGRGRYNKHMAPTILLSEWRKGNQWFEVQRKLAIEIVSDVMIYPILRDYCKPRCYMDEHYLATLVTKIGKGLNSNRTVTWVDWSRPGSHPTTFVSKDVSEVFFRRLRNQSKCVYNNLPGSICFLFARKFHPNTLEPLLRVAPLLFQF
ncbi:2-succinyl-5-enolpyruvyl-6-hydroxy-3-cyclohexene-1-carboxylate synthase [Bienertia sinuspersici]